MTFGEWLREMGRVVRMSAEQRLGRTVLMTYGLLLAATLLTVLLSTVAMAVGVGW